MRKSRRSEASPASPPRRLFLDDDPERAAVFLVEYPDAVWVETVKACIERLGETWDEVHLDHDLGGEQYVDLTRNDCGMAVVRWLEAEPRLHLRVTRFVVHSHNAVAAYLMTLQMRSLGLRVETSPFGLGRWKAPTPSPPGLIRRLFGRLFSGRRSVPCEPETVGP